MITEQVLLTASAQMLFDLVHCGKQRIHVLVVRGLCRGEAGLVDSVIDQMVHPLVHLVDVAAEGGRVETPARSVSLLQLRRQQVIEFGIHHADNLAALVVHDGFGLGIPEHGDGIAACIRRVGFEIELLEEPEAIERLEGTR
jgi:hypothetical protein